MRLWSVHPRYLDRQALVACWRESLLAQAVLRGRSRGYTRHPQLERFRDQEAPVGAVSAFLIGLADEADGRGYRFDRGKIAVPEPGAAVIPVALGQLEYEWSHLRAKLEARSPDVARRWAGVAAPEPHPLFVAVAGPIASWERPIT